MTPQEKIERLERALARCADAYLQKVCPRRDHRTAQAAEEGTGAMSLAWTLRRKLYDAKYYLAAARELPSGLLCGWCHRPNFFADDCGWFAITPTGNDTRITCERCYRGPLGEAHIARYGLGER